MKHLLAPGKRKENYGGIWARAGTVIDPLTGNLFLATGNGPFTANQGGSDWGESVLELSSDGAGGVLFAATVYDRILALDPRSGHHLWSSAEPTAKGSIGSIHWESPIVVGGRLYCSDEEGNVSAYGL